MKLPKGKSAAKAPVGVTLLVAFDLEDGRTTYATMRARKGTDRFCNECLLWCYMPFSRSADYAPDWYWELP